MQQESGATFCPLFCTSMKNDNLIDRFEGFCGDCPVDSCCPICCLGCCGVSNNKANGCWCWTCCCITTSDDAYNYAYMTFWLLLSCITYSIRNNIEQTTNAIIRCDLLSLLGCGCGFGSDMIQCEGCCLGLGVNCGIDNKSEPFCHLYNCFFGWMMK